MMIYVQDTESNKSDDKEFKGEESKGKEATISKKYKKSKKVPSLVAWNRCPLMYGPLL